MTENFTLLKEVLQLLEDCINIVKRHPKSFAFIAGLFFCYCLLKHMAYNRPREAIQQYFTAINEKEYDKAWYKLSERYKESIHNNNRDKFRLGYSTTSHFGNIEIEFSESKANPLKDIFSPDRMYKTSYEVEDKINRDDLSESGLQAWNSFWVQVRKELPLSRLKTSPQRLFTIRRVFYQEIRVIKEHGKWKIAQMKTMEVGIKIQ